MRFFGMGQSIDRLLMNNAFVRVLAVCVAVTLWVIVVTDADSPATPPASGPRITRTMTVGVRGLPPGMVVRSGPGTVDVTVQGKAGQPDMGGIPMDASVSLAGKGPGSTRARVMVRVPTGVTVVAVEPPTVGITLDGTVERVFPVTVGTHGAPRQGMFVTGVAVEPDRARVLGPAKAMGRVGNVVAIADAGGVRGSTSVMAALVPVDASGRPVEGLTVRPPECRVTVKAGPIGSDAPVDMNTGPYGENIPDTE